MSRSGLPKRVRSVSTRLRFDVFKRDDFACQYCGRKTPAVVLECDHIVPIAEGGGDEIENLTTSCFDCNRGKGARSLTTKRTNADLKERRLLIADQEAQLRAYNRAVRERIDRENAAYDEAWDYWFELRDAKTLPRNETPFANVLRSYLRKLPLEQVKRAMLIAYERFGRGTAAPAYFGGVLKGMLAESEGRITACQECGKRITLEPGSDPSLKWWHNPCLQRARQEGRAP